MLFEEISLTPQDILDKEFKIDTRGFRPQEVDKFLDIVIADYTKFISLVKRLDSEKKELIEENICGMIFPVVFCNVKIADEAVIFFIAGLSILICR